MNCNFRVEKTKALIGFGITAKLICAFGLRMQIIGFLMRKPYFIMKIIDGADIIMLNNHCK